MTGNYVIKQDRKLYQLFPDDNGIAAFALEIPRKHSIDDSKKVWDRYIEYRSKSKIDYIGDMINQNLTYKDVITKLDF